MNIIVESVIQLVSKTIEWTQIGIEFYRFSSLIFLPWPRRNEYGEEAVLSWRWFHAAVGRVGQRRSYGPKKNRL